MSSANYLPSFFRIKIPTNETLDNIKLLPEREQGLYYHEYIHYLQDLTTTFGVMKIWNSYDRVRQVVVDVFGHQGTVTLPMSTPAVIDQKGYQLFLVRQEGAFRVRPEWTFTPLREMANKYNIKSVQLTADPLIQQILPVNNLKHVDLILESPNMPDETYRFGQNAVSEAMAYLAEVKLYSLGTPERYPYLVAADLANFLYSPIGQNDEFLFALCDVALMHPLPGLAFYTLLEEMKAKGFVPGSGEEVINFGFTQYLSNGWDIQWQCRQAEYSIQHIINQLYNHPYFANTLLWLHFVISGGQALRWAKPYFFLELYRQQQRLSPEFTKVWDDLGGPLCINGDGMAYIKEPINLTHLSGSIHPQHFLITKQLNDFLLKGTVRCTLKSICAKMKSRIPVDDRCDDEPWARAKDPQQCPYGAAWNLYSFNKNTFTINGTPI